MTVKAEAKVSETITAAERERLEEAAEYFENEAAEWFTVMTDKLGKAEDGSQAASEEGIRFAGYAKAIRSLLRAPAEEERDAVEAPSMLEHHRAFIETLTEGEREQYAREAITGLLSTSRVVSRHGLHGAADFMERAAAVLLRAPASPVGEPEKFAVEGDRPAADYEIATRLDAAATWENIAAYWRNTFRRAAKIIRRAAPTSQPAGAEVPRGIDTLNAVTPDASLDTSERSEASVKEASPTNSDVGAAADRTSQPELSQEIRDAIRRVATLGSGEAILALEYLLKRHISAQGEVIVVNEPEHPLAANLRRLPTLSLLEQEIHDRFTVIRMDGREYRVDVKVDHQSFCITPDARETLGEADWFRHQAAVTLARMVGKLSVARPIDVVAAVVRKGGLWWLCKRNGDGEHGGLEGMWEYPGGKVEPGEEREEALEREMHEEFGVAVNVGRLLDVITTETAGKLYRVHFYSVELCGWAQLSKHSEARWMTAAEVMATEHLPSGAEFNRRHVMKYA